MAKVKALISFAGKVCMAQNEIGEVADEAILSDLVRAGYVEVINEQQKAPAKKGTKK